MSRRSRYDVAGLVAVVVSQLRDARYCERCDRYFESTVAMIQHVEHSSAHKGGHYESETRSRPFYPESFVCNLCDRVFETKQALEQHERDSPAHLSPSDQPAALEYYCEDCDRIFYSQRALDQHLVDSPAHWPSEYEHDNYYCDDEDDHDDDNNGDEDESDDCYDEEGAYCDACDRYFVNEMALDQHVRDSFAHRPNEDKSPATRSAPSAPAPGATFDDSLLDVAAPDGIPLAPALMPSPLRPEHQVKGSSAQASDQAMNLLSVHFSNLSLADIKIKCDIRLASTLYNCQTCERSFDTQQALDQHFTNSTVHRVHDCTSCHRAFESEQALAQHIKHAPAHARKFDCKVCDRSFSSEDALVSHMQDSQAHQDPAGNGASWNRTFRALKNLY